MTALSAHRPWCTDPGHDGATPCLSAPLRLEFPETADRDAEKLAGVALELAAEPGDTPSLSVVTSHSDDPCDLDGFSLHPAQIRPLAMALLAMDAHLADDPDLAAFYRSEALLGTAAV